MKIEIPTTEKSINKWRSIPLYQPAEMLSSNQEISRNHAGWRRIRSETPPLIKLSTEKKCQEQLEIQIDQAIEAGQYEEALRWIDQMKDISHYSQISKFRLKSYVLKKLGRLEEAYSFATAALEKIASIADEEREKLLAFLREHNPYAGMDHEFAELQIDLLLDLFKNLGRLEETYPFVTAALEKIAFLADEEREQFLAFLREHNPYAGMDHEFVELHRDLLLKRGFLALALNRKELAIEDFRKAAHCQVDDYDKCYDPEFLFRVLEKALGTQIAPFKDYEKEIAALLQENYLYEEERYQLVMYYALVGQHREALEWYEKIEQIDDFPAEVPFFLAYLKGDMETAKKELENCPNEDYRLIVSNGLSVAKVHPKASMRKFMGESAASLLKIQVGAPSSLDLHDETIVKDLQKLVHIEECKRVLNELNKELENFDRDLKDPKLNPFERELKIFQKPSLYQKRSALNFLLGNLKDALADEWTHQSLNCDFYNQIALSLMKYPNYTYHNGLNDNQTYSLVVAGMGDLLFNQEQRGIEQLSLAASSGSSFALLILLALGKTPPVPMDCNPVQPKPKEIIDEAFLAGYDETLRQRHREIIETHNQKIANENFFAHLKELFQRQKYHQVIEEIDPFLAKTKLETWESRLFFHIRGASKAALHEFPLAIGDYDQAGNHQERVIERALVKILAGDRAGAKADLQGMAATRGYVHEKPISANAFATYNFDPWKTRAMMIEKLFEL